MKIDWGLASFQLRFKVDRETFENWFGSKIHFLSEDRILIVQFFEFQYGQSKDTWSMKIEAKKSLENMGFSIVNNRLVIDQNEESGYTVPPQCGDSVPTTLIRVRVKSKELRVKNKELEEKIENIYSEFYPLKKGKQKGIEKLLQTLSPDEIDLFERAVKAYRADCESNATQPRYIQHFSTFVSHWRDWADPAAGTSPVNPQNQHTDMFSKIREKEGLL